jgi:hypothetical protein
VPSWPLFCQPITEELQLTCSALIGPLGIAPLPSSSVYTTHINGTHTTDISLYIYRFLYRYTVLLYTSCTDGLYLCVHNCTLLYDYLNIRLWCTHYAWISYTAVRLYCSPFSVHSGPVLLCIQLQCTTVHALVPSWPLFCQPITEELRFTCSDMIGPLSIAPLPSSS